MIRRRQYCINERRQSRAAALVWRDGGAYRFFPGAKARAGFAVFFAFAAVAAAAFYIFAVNAILFHGENLRALNGELKALTKDYARIRDIAARQESPSWLEKNSEASGLVEVRGVRFITEDQSVAFSR